MIKQLGQKERRARGSFRVLRIAWGNFAGSNVKNFKKGIGRYSNIDSYWRDNFDYYEKDKLEPLYETKSVCNTRKRYINFK